MSVNTMTFEQAAAILNNIKSQVTGESGLAPVNTSEFISVATKTIAAGYDPVLRAITQMVTRTIFSIRPYEAKMKGIMMDSQKWGSIVRKLAISDKAWDDNEEFSLTDGESVDMFVVNKPDVLQLNYYGAITYQRHYTIFKDQLDNAFSGPDQFSQFMSMVVQNCMDIIEQTREAVARSCIANFIAGIYIDDDINNRVIHLVSEYNNAVDGDYTAETIMFPDVFPDFVKWAYARIADLTQLMTERSSLYQTQIEEHILNRHTPFERQKVYLFSRFLEEINARVKGDVFHDNYLSLADVEAIPFWQNIYDRTSIECKPVRLLTDGTLQAATDPVSVNGVLGVIFDEEALGYTVMNEWSATTPLNAAGGYWNTYFHYLIRYYNDFTEKGIVLLLD